MYGHPDDTASGLWYISLLILTFLNRCMSKLAWLTLNLGVLLIAVCSFLLCGSIVANPIICRLVPSPSRFENRQWFVVWLRTVSRQNTHGETKLNEPDMPPKRTKKVRYQDSRASDWLIANLGTVTPQTTRRLGCMTKNAPQFHSCLRPANADVFPAVAIPRESTLVTVGHVFLDFSRFHRCDWREGLES